MHPLLRNTESLESLHVAADALAAVSLENAFIDPAHVSFESFFSNVANRFTYGSDAVQKVELKPIISTAARSLAELGYIKGRTILIPVAPGFCGHMKDFLPHLKSLVDILPNLPNELKVLKANMAWALNDPSQMKNMSGLPKFTELKGLDIKELDKLKTFFNPNSVNTQPFGLIFANISEWESHYATLRQITNVADTVDFLAITNLSKQFSELANDFHAASQRGSLNTEMSTQAVAHLSSAVRRLATAVTASAVVQALLNEVVSASNAQPSAIESGITALKRG